jgi:integrase
MPYPAGPAYQMLMLTALRLYESTNTSRPEIQKNGVLIIPAERMKGKNDKAREHAVPLSTTALDMIAKLPRLNGGPYLFSFSNGETPMKMTTAIKRDLDRRMLRTLKALARQRGADRNTVKRMKLPRWTNHDVRRTVRSELSALRIPQNVAEAVLAHVPPEIIGTYDVYTFLDEKREALEAWAKRLAAIVNPAPVTDNVVAFAR